MPRQRRHSFQNKLYCPFDQIDLRQFKRIGTPSTPNNAQINMDKLVLLSDRSLCIILFSPLSRISAVAHRLECATDNRAFTGSNHTEVVWKLFSISFTPLNFASVFRKRLYRTHRTCDVQLSAMFSIISGFICQAYLNFFMHAFIQSFNISMYVNGAPIHVNIMHKPY